MATPDIATTFSQPDLVAHIVDHYHEALRRDMPPLIAAAREVERVHAGKPDVPAGLADVLDDFWSAMQQHMLKEEQVLFPMLARGACGSQVYMPVRVMEHEHDEHAVCIARIRALTAHYASPPQACATWRALYDGLAAMDQALVQHVDLENTVLFPRATGAR